ncbi:MAG: glucose-6-phosphate isomerase [Desulfobacterales bacterium]|nr:glucose-6-phosphate isomerase [Desulfobacterales bacterium]
MCMTKVNELLVWNNLKQYSDEMNTPAKHLKNLIKEPDRLKNFCIKDGGILFDFSRQRVDKKVMELLFELAEKTDVQKKFSDMAKGAIVNTTEKRAALHTATRSSSNEPLFVDGIDIIPEMNRVKKEFKEFSEKIHSGEIKGSAGKPFKHIVVIGIGGSYLGAEFVSTALCSYADKGINIHYLANVDIHDFGRIASQIDPETTLWLVISKSYTTAETTANTVQAYEFMKSKGLDPSKHFATVTSKGSPGDDPSNPVLSAFHMFDFIGGRYSVTSAVGGVPLSIYFGYDKFERFLKGAEEMDIHANTAPIDKNLPLISALIGIWNNDFLGYKAQGIIPYASPLSKLAPHVQQLYMESNGKLATKDGKLIDVDTGVIIFGEPGTNAQHSFFQLAHQGKPFPIDFIGVINPQYNQYKSMSKGVTNHQELWANLIAQPMALAEGKDSEDKAKFFPGNRPSSTILLNDLSPESIGRILSFYEARTVYEAFIWDLNPFDQFGVELGKKLASSIRKQMEEKNKNADYKVSSIDPISEFYVNTLFNGSI